MGKGSEVIYGRGHLAQFLKVPAHVIRWMEQTGKIKPKKESLGDMTCNAYTRQDIEKIKQHNWRK